MSKMLHTAQRIFVTASGDVLTIRSQYDPSVVEFFYSLPGAKWNSYAKVWQCDATPAGCWRLVNRFEGSIEADEATLRMSAAFSAAMIDGRSGPLEQPPLRKTDGWRHQLEAYRMVRHHPATLLHMGMGSGKSWVAVQHVVNSEAKRTLILCPLSVVNVWPREFEKHAVQSWDGGIYCASEGTVATRAARVEASVKTVLRGFPRVVVLNYDSAWRPAMAAVLLAQNWDVVILDESHRAKSPSTQIGKFVEKLGRRAGTRLCLTGTPMPHSPLDLCAQFRFLDRGLFGSSFHHFRNRYAKMNAVFPGKVDRWLNQDELRDRAALLTYHVGSEVLDLPPINHIVRRAELTGEAARVYHDLENEFISDVKRGVCTAANALTRLIRLQQVTSGYVQTDDEGPQVEVGTEKEMMLADILQDLPTEEPVVVFCWFKHDLDVAKRVSESLGRRYTEVSGRGKDGLTGAALMRDDVDTLGVQTRSGGLGVDLTRARYAVFFSQSWSPADEDQAVARVHRPGQTRPTVIYHLLASTPQGSIDDTMRGALAAKREVVGAIVEGFKQRR